MPQRIQRKRTKGWRMPPGAVYVGRPSPLGNHYRVWCDDDGLWTVSWCGCHYLPSENTREAAAALAAEKYRQDVETEGPQNYRGRDPVPTHSDIIKALRGSDLACWCSLDQPCHADVLLKIANGPLS